MNVLERLYPGDAAAALAFSASVQIAGVVLLGWLLARTVARRNPAIVYGLWVAVLVVAGLGPLAAWGLHRSGVSLVRLPWLAPAPVETARDEAPATVTVSEPIRHTGDAGDVQAPADLSLGPHDAPAVPFASPRAAEAAAPTMPAAMPRGGDGRWFRSLAGLAVAVWALGAALLAGRLARGFRMLALLRRGLSPLESAQIRAATRRACRTLGVRALAPVATSRHIDGPLSLGVLRPVIVLPEGLAESLTERQLHDVLVHEGAHFLHRDHLLGLCQRLVQILYWPHPAVYLLGGELARAREELCDNHVLLGGDATAYARTLLAVSGRVRPRQAVFSAIGFFSAHGGLEDRVARLVDRRRRRATRVASPALALAGLVFLATAAAAAGVRLVARAPDEPSPVVLLSADENAAPADAAPTAEPSLVARASDPADVAAALGALRPEMCVEQSDGQYRVRLRAEGVGQPTLWVAPAVPAQLTFGRQEPGGDEVSFALSVTVRALDDRRGEVLAAYRFDRSAGDQRQRWESDGVTCALGRWWPMRRAATADAPPAPVAQAPSATAPDAMPAIPGFWLLRLEHVQDELELSAWQRERLRDIGLMLAEAARQDLVAPDVAPTGAEQAGRQAEFAERQRARGEQAQAEVLGLLRTEQLARLGEIEFRVRGPASLRSDAVLDQLGVSPEQRRRLAETQERLDAEQRRLQREAFEQDIHVLTAEQVDRLKAIYFPGGNTAVADTRGVAPAVRVTMNTP